MWGQKIGSWIGVVAGLAFVLVNAGKLAEPWPVIVRAAAVVAAAVVGLVLVRTPGGGDAAPPDRRAIRVYGWCVTAMVVAIPIGAALLNGPLGLPKLTVVWVVAVVGAHFLPFAAAFHAPVFRPLALTLIAVAAIGAVATLLTGEVAAAVTAVVAGFVLLGFAARPHLEQMPNIRNRRD